MLMSALSTARSRSISRNGECQRLQQKKIREIGETLVEAGLNTLDQQARALNLPRSTAWTVLKANHKASGLSVAVIGRILSSSHLPSRVRIKVLEYISEKSRGLYGDKEYRARRFRARLTEFGIMFSWPSNPDGSQSTPENTAPRSPRSKVAG